MQILNYWTLQIVFWYILSGLLISCDQDKEPIMLSEEDKQSIETLARDLPLILSNKGWDAYEEKFSKDYQNWSMVSDEVRSRTDFLTLVKKWYDDGNRATGSSLKTIEFIPLDDQNVMYLYALQEQFNESQDSTLTNIRDIRFVATYRKESGIWKNTFTAFMDLPKTQ